MSKRNIFLFGVAVGAWLNIWPSPIFHYPFASFIFAYILVFYALFRMTMEKR